MAGTTRTLKARGLERGCCAVAAAALGACVLGAGLPIVASADQPVASKSGSAVAENGRIIFQVDAGGGSAQDITRCATTAASPPAGVGATDDRDATFSPDGRRIAFRRNGGGADTDTFVANSDGTNP